MSFVQIIEYETDRFDELRALGDSQQGMMESMPPGFHVTITQDRDRPNHFFTVVEFPSYEMAMANSDRPETADFAAQMAALCTSPPRFYNLDVRATMP